MTTQAIEKFCKDNNIDNYKVSNGVLTINQTVKLAKPYTQIPVKIGLVDGDFIISKNDSLLNGPRLVNGDFIFGQSTLNSLYGMPDKIAGDVSLYNHNMSTLEHLTPYIGGTFTCSGNNNLTSLSAPKQYIGGDFKCYENKKLPMFELRHTLLWTIKGRISTNHSFLDLILNKWKNCDKKDLPKAFSEIKKFIAINEKFKTSKLGTWYEFTTILEKNIKNKKHIPWVAYTIVNTNYSVKNLSLINEYLELFDANINGDLYEYKTFDDLYNVVKPFIKIPKDEFETLYNTTNGWIKKALTKRAFDYLIRKYNTNCSTDNFTSIIFIYDKKTKLCSCEDLNTIDINSIPLWAKQGVEKITTGTTLKNAVEMAKSGVEVNNEHADLIKMMKDFGVL